MRLIFYNPDSPKSNNKCPYKRKVKEDLRQTEEKIQRGGDVKKKGQDWSDQLQGMPTATRA